MDLTSITDEELIGLYRKEIETRDFYDLYQNVVKVNCNSLFGALAAPGYRYCHKYFGEAITLNGQLAVKWGEKTVNNYMNSLLKTEDVDYVIYIDTDSITINMDALVKKTGLVNKNDIIDFIDKFVKQKIDPLLKEAYDTLAEEMNYAMNRTHFKREKINENAIFLEKKRYIMNVWDKEGTRYSEPKINVTGIESVRSTTPEISRKALKRSFEIILNQDNEKIIAFKDDFRVKFMKENPENIAIPKTANNLDQYSNADTIYGFKTPLHVRGSLLFNHHLKKMGLDAKYETIKEGEKIKYLYLKLPNPIKENVIAFPQFLPEEMGLHDYVDYVKMYEKGFLEPLDKIIERINWKTDSVMTLEDFFG